MHDDTLSNSQGDVSSGGQQFTRHNNSDSGLANYSPAYGLQWAARQRPDSLSLVDAGDGTSWTVAEAWADVQLTAEVLRGFGVGYCDRVMICTANSPWHFIIHVACSLLGAVTVPVSERLPKQQRKTIVEDCQPRIIFASDTACEQGAHSDDTAQTCRSFPLESLVGRVQELKTSQTATEALSIIPVESRSEEIAAIVYTSGSSGVPRGVALSHRHLWWASRNFREGFQYAPGHDVVGVCAPLSHIGGFNGTSMDMFTSGGALVVFPEFAPDLVAHGIQHWGITTMFVVPAMCRPLFAAADRGGYSLHSWKRPLVGGDCLTMTLADEFAQRGLSPIHVWGMTETGGAGAMASPELWQRCPGSMGLAFPFVHLSLHHPDGSLITVPEVVGEIRVSGPNVVVPFGSDSLATGDLARFDESGALYFFSRSSRLLNTGGELVAPIVVEEALRSLPYVADALVVGVPNEQWGQKVAALVVPTESGEVASTLSLKDIHEALAQRLAPWQLPRMLKWVDHLPRTSTGKPDPGAALHSFTNT